MTNGEHSVVQPTAPHLARPRLESRVCAAPVTLLIAPAGFGKTAAIRSALGTDPDVELVWVSGGDHRDCVEELEQIVTSAPAPVARSRVVVVDDAHLLPRADDLLFDVLVARCVAAGIRVVVSTRTPLASAIWPLEVSGTADTIWARDLCFDDAELAELLGPSHVGRVGDVRDLTAGWPAAVQLVVRHLRRNQEGPIDEAVLVLESLVSDMLEALDPMDLAMLLDTSVCDEMSPGVAARMVGDSQAPFRLRRLSQRAGLLREDTNGWFYQSRLMRTVLDQPRPERGVRSTLADHVRAGDAWMDEPATTQALFQAARHLIAGHEWVRALELLRRHWLDFYTDARVADLVDLIESVPVRWWRDDPGVTLLVAWGNQLVGRGARSSTLFISPCLLTPAGRVAAQLAWAQGVYWTADPVQAITAVEDGRRGLELLGVDSALPNLPGNHTAGAYRIVADGAEARARLLLGDVAGATQRLERLLERESNVEPISAANLRGSAALARVLLGDRDEAVGHLRVVDAFVNELRVVDHPLLAPADLARAALAALAGDDEDALNHLVSASNKAAQIGASNLRRVCAMVEGWCWTESPSVGEQQPAAAATRVPLADDDIAARVARNLAELGDVRAAEVMLQSIRPNERTLSAWVDVSLQRHPISEVRRWIDDQPAPNGEHGRLVRLLVEAATENVASDAVTRIREAATIATQRHLLGVLRDAPSALWARPEILLLGLREVNDALAMIRSRTERQIALRFTNREIELLTLMAGGATAREMSDRWFVSVNTVKWHKANVYRKLGVSGRDAALRRAAELGLLRDRSPGT